MSPDHPIERRAILAERLKSPSFGRDVEKITGTADAATFLSGRQYSGQGKLKTSVLKDNVQIEIRIEGASSDQAPALANAVCATLVQQQDAILRPLYELMIERVHALKDWIKGLEDGNRPIVSTMSAGGTETSSVAAFSILLAVKARGIKDHNLLVEIQADLLPPNSVATHVASALAIRKPALGAALALILVGTIAGGRVRLVGLLPRRANA